MYHRLLGLSAGMALAALTAMPAWAQISVQNDVTAAPPAGWSFTPALTYTFAWDSNVLLENLNVGSDIVDEQLHLVRPGALLAFSSRRGNLNVNYEGAFVQHLELRSLNSFDQRLSADATRQLSRRVSFSARYSALAAPSTELVELVGVPFVRIGSRRHDLQTGVTVALRRSTEASASYGYQVVDFDSDGSTNLQLNGGYRHGAQAGVKHTITRRLALTGDWDFSYATVEDGGHFALQNSWVGVDYDIREGLRAFGAAGVSHLAAVAGRAARTGPSMRVGVTRQVAPASLHVVYSRSYVPSYSFGGTTDNEELTTRLTVPLTRRLYTGASLSIRQNEPLDDLGLTLRSTWLHGSVGYLLTNWLRAEAYAAGVRQNVARIEGRINRYQLGFQLTAATTARIR